MTKLNTSLNDSFDRKKKISLLLSGFTSKQFLRFIKVIYPEQKAVVQNTVNRWIQGTHKATHIFFEENEVAEYLNPLLQDKVAIVDKVFHLLNIEFPKLNPSYRLETNRDVIAMRYTKLAFNDESNTYSAIRLMSEANRAYYTERNQPEFLQLHLNALEEVIGRSDAQKINDRLLTVQNPVSGELYSFPVIDLNISFNGINLKPELDDCKQQKAVPDEFLKAVRISQPKIYNKPTFAVNHFDKTTGDMTCYISNYFKALYHCDNHYYQVVGNYPGYNSNNIEEYTNSHSIATWAEELKSVVIGNDFKNLELSLGSSCLFIYNTESHGYQALLAKKSQGANGFNDFHVIPASMLQPVGNNPLNYHLELNIKIQVIRELAEEVFNYPEATGSHANNLIDEIYSYPEISHLESLLKSGEAEFHVTGFYLDLFRLRPEILSTIIIHDKEWAKEHFGAFKVLGNWEIEKEGVVAIDLSDNNFYKVLEGQVGFLCAPGAASFVKGYKKFKEIIKNN